MVWRFVCYVSKITLPNPDLGAKRGYNVKKCFLYVAILFFVATGLTARTVRADGGTVVGSYNCSGSITTTLGSSSETITFSFVLDQIEQDPATVVTQILGTPPVHSIGSLDAFSFSQFAFSGYGPFTNSDGDEIDLMILGGQGLSDLTPPTAISAEIYSCISAACQAAFSPGIPQFGGFGFPASFTFSAQPVPEPSSLWMLGAGLLLLPIVKKLAA